jgi:F0F1-type ATP synthase assembly protein I
MPPARTPWFVRQLERGSGRRKELRNGKREKGGVYTQVARYSSIIFLLPSCLLVGYLIGYLLDRRLDSDPWISVAGLLLGGVAGLVRVVRMFSR